MATQKPISTISYNSVPFLQEKLDAWYHAHIIQSYQYILHKGEDGDKDHIHLRIEPNKKLDPMDLQEELREYVMGQEKPLGCRPFRPSKEEDWYMYVVHDKDYLSLKYGGGERGEKIPYDWSDIVAPEDYDTEIAFIRARAALKHSSASVAARLQSGENPLNLVFEGENVYTVNAIMRSLADNDYRRVLSELDEANQYLHAILDALSDYGLTPVQDPDGKVHLEGVIE